ncbi:hypothetical protein ACIFQM_00825 [Paenibacillus sp. NRS-1782]|uniref:hypothetical protein n=1 Tax=unclassified Paenibacillus TaxID=185978 RepID=UPI003D283F5A
MKNVMVRAWEIAKAAVVKFGGKEKEYFPQALALAWKENKKGVTGVKVHTWTTEKGAEIELHTEHVTEEKTTTDWGMVISKKVNFVFIQKVFVNGKKHVNDLRRKKVNGVSMLSLGYASAVIPADVEKAAWGEYDSIESAKRAAKQQASVRRMKEREALSKKPGYCTKCGSFCWGDCTAN